jgi:uncharacterized membrane-anchored protein YitT (DUF2179 family)
MSDWLFLPIHVSALLGGSIVGVGAGILFRVGVATEGLDLFAQVVEKSYKMECRYHPFYS